MSDLFVEPGFVNQGFFADPYMPPEDPGPFTLQPDAELYTLTIEEEEVTT